MERNYDVIAFTSKYYLLRRPGVAIFAEIIKIVTICIEKKLKTQKTLKEFEIMYENAIYICILYFLM